MGEGKRQSQKKEDQFEHLNGNRIKVNMSAVLVFDGEVPSDSIIKQEAEEIFFGRVDMDRGLEGRSFIHGTHRTIVESMEIEVEKK